MKKLYRISLLILLFGLNNNAKSQNLVWAKQFGGANHEEGYSIALDANGNVYTTGRFTDTVDFDPGPGTYNLTSPIGYRGIFISKLDASGNFLWAKQLGGVYGGEGYSIAFSAIGAVYTIGKFAGTGDFDPGVGVYNLSGGGIFISKLDASGNFVWAKSIQASTSVSTASSSIVIDASENLYTTGSFGLTVDFNPGTGTYNLTSAGGADAFVLKLDSSGNFVWAKRMGGLCDDYGNSIAIDINGNVYTSGSFHCTADFDPGIGTYNLISGDGSFDIFISKLDSSGNFLWAKQMGGVGYDWSNSIALDTSGNVYSTGRFEGTADFDPGIGTYNLISGGGVSDIFISKLDSSGNFVWAKQMGGTGAETGYSIALDINGNVYTTGYFGGLFLSKHDMAGNFVSAIQISGAVGFCTTLEANGNVYITGLFSGTTDFDPGTGTYNMTSSGNDIFVVKLSDTPTGMAENYNLLNEITIYPNPSHGQFNVAGSIVIDELKITNLLGQIIYQTKPNENNFSLQLDEAGIYFINITSATQTTTKKLIVYK